MKSNLSQITKGIQIVIDKHSPEILTGIGVAGMITTTVMAVQATPKALLILQDKWDNELGADIITNKDRDYFTLLEKAKLTWKCYIPSAVTGGLSIACLIGASSVNIRRNAALATAYKLSESALKEYRNKVIETIGEKKEQAVNDAVIKDKLDRNPISSQEVIITEKGDTLCYDVISGRYFKSNIDKLKKALNELNRMLLTDMYVSMNDLYYEIGLNSTKQGQDIGWNIDNGLIDLHFSSQLASDGTPCLVLDYQVAPRYDFMR